MIDGMKSKLTQRGNVCLPLEKRAHGPIIQTASSFRISVDIGDMEKTTHYVICHPLFFITFPHQMWSNMYNAAPLVLIEQK